MKKLKFVTIALLTLCMCLSLAACGGDNKSVDKETSDSTPQTNVSDTEPDEPEKSNASVEEEYKIDECINTENASGVMGTAWIKLTELASMRRGAGQVVDQSDDTLILMGDNI